MKKLIFLISLVNLVHRSSQFCWKPNTNPFTGDPGVERIDPSTVRVIWEDIFPKGRDCEDVDFLIKSHPLNSPSNYKLSDFTMRGHRTATLDVPPNSDFIFQVIARENKGKGHGIEYAYSRPATSMANPTTDDKKVLKKSIWVAGSNPRTGTLETRSGLGRGTVAPVGRRRTVPTLPPDYRYKPTTESISAPVTQPRVYKRPQLKSLDSEERGGFIAVAPLAPPAPVAPRRMIAVNSNVVKANSNTGAGSGQEIRHCVPLLKDIGSLSQGSQKSSMIWKFLKYMNQNALQHVRSFVELNKGEERKKGHLVDVLGSSKCCSTPWAETGEESVCYDRFAKCDGGCIPSDWVSDGWPDCMDGSDERGMSSNGKVLPHQLGCIQCAGTVLSAGFICQQTEGLTRSCVESVLGPGQCNVCIEDYLDF